MIIHLDMDAFYASVEQLDQPHLKGKCVIVGGTSGRGVVSAASYEARKCGVHSAMPVFQAKQKCPHGIFVPPRLQRYKFVSQSIMAILKQFSPVIEQVSIDEAYMDISGSEKLFGPPDVLGRKIKSEIRSRTDLTCSIGIAPIRFLAKIASDMDKPNGLVLIQKDQMEDFVKQLPIHKVPGIGSHWQNQLHRFGINCLGDVLNYPDSIIIKKFGKAGKRLIELANCCDRQTLNPHSPHKSISTERTLSKNTHDLNQLTLYILSHCEEVGRELRTLKLKAKTISIKIKYADFKLQTRSRTLANHTQSTDIIYKTARDLLNSKALIKPVRLVGVGVSNIQPENTPTQKLLFSDAKGTKKKWEKVDHALDSIVDKFGKDAIKRGALTD